MALALVVCSCTVSTETEKYQRRRNNIIDVRDKITEIKIDDPILNSLNRLYLIEDYLIIQDFQALDKLIHLFDKNDFSYVTGVGYRGQGPDELTNMGYITVDKARHSFYVNDYGKQKIFVYHLDSVLSNPAYAPEVKMEINETIFPSRFQLINDSIAICRIIEPIGTNNFKPMPGKMNMNTGEITLMKYEHPKIKTDRKRSSVAASIEHGLYAEYYERFDLMTLCTLDGDLICNIYGPGWKNDDRRTKYYQNVVFCGDKIYASYSGGKPFDEQMRSIQGTKIIVFDMQGNYIHTLETGLHISDFCYDGDNNRLLLSQYAGDNDIQFAYLPL
jgi:hypothetical protein